MSVLPDTPESEALRWLRFAQEDLTAARELDRGGIVLRIACFHAQQAAEKALKALLILNQIPPPRTHGLSSIRRQVPGDLALQITEDELDELSVWAVEPRYPGDVPEATGRDAQGAIAVADEVVAAVGARLASLEAPPQEEGEIP